MQPFYLARQPIYDRQLQVVAYELLFRGEPVTEARFDNGDHATSAVITSSIIDIGLEQLVGSRMAFINATRSFLNGDLPLPDLKDRLVIEVLEDIEPDEGLVACLEGLSNSGYQLALDDFVYRPEYQPLLGMADYIKLDVRALSPESLAEHVRHLRRYDAKLIAEKVETYSDLARCRDLEFDLYQGFFFCRPKLIQGRRLESNRLLVMQLIARLQDPDTECDELERLVASDPSLSYHLLKYINSAYCGMRSTVTSIRQAVMLVGMNLIRSWTTLLLLSRFQDGKPAELIVTALIRAKMCELLGGHDTGHGKDQYFTVGLLSVLDALLDLPLDRALDGLPFTADTRAALCEGSGQLGRTLRRVIAYEQAGLDEADDLAGLAEAYLKAVAWTAETQQGFAA